MATNTESAASAWAREAIRSAISAGLVPENLQSSYQQPISRAELTALSVVYVEARTGISIGAYLAQNGVEIDPASFIDTQDPSILSAHALGIIQGAGDDRFDPDSAINRELITVIISRTLQLFEAGEVFAVSSASYVDLHLASGWSIPYIDYVTEQGIMGGVGDNRFDPLGNCTREQAIIIFYRMFSNT